jgi:hypothetical protein
MSETEKQFVVRFVPKATEALTEMAKEEGVTVGELIGRAVNFYQLHIDAEKYHKHILLQRPDGVIERVI